MTNETDRPDPLSEEIAELVKAGWQADDTTWGLERPEQFPSFSETLTYLMDVGDKAGKLGVMPSIHIDGGTRVNVRIGRPPAPGLSADEIRLAKALT
jgi:pterin-4a-carbinolamine dehydratase